MTYFSFFELFNRYNMNHQCEQQIQLSVHSKGGRILPFAPFPHPTKHLCILVLPPS